MSDAYVWIELKEAKQTIGAVNKEFKTASVSNNVKMRSERKNENVNENRWKGERTENEHRARMHSIELLRLDRCCSLQFYYC